MQFMVFAVGDDLSYRFSNCGSDWSIGTFKDGIVSVQLDLIRSALVLDCLGCRRETDLGPIWHITRDDMTATEVIRVCHRICAGRKYTSMFDLTAMVVRLVCDAMGYNQDASRVGAVAAEVNRSFFANEIMKEKP